MQPGARIDRRITPTAPPGYRFEPSDDGLGVLAPSSSFAPIAHEDMAFSRETHRLGWAREMIEAAHPASAVWSLRGRATANQRKRRMELRAEAERAL